MIDLCDSARLARLPAMRPIGSACLHPANGKNACQGDHGASEYMLNCNFKGATRLVWLDPVYQPVARSRYGDLLHPERVFFGCSLIDPNGQPLILDGDSLVVFIPAARGGLRGQGRGLTVPAYFTANKISRYKQGSDPPPAYFQTPTGAAMIDRFAHMIGGFWSDLLGLRLEVLLGEATDVE